MICANCSSEIDNWSVGESEICDSCWGSDPKPEFVAPSTELYLCSYTRHSGNKIETIIEATNAEHASRIAAITFKGFAAVDTRKFHPSWSTHYNEIQFVVESNALIGRAGDGLVTSKFLQKVSAIADIENSDTDFYMLVRDKLNDNNMQVQLTVGESKMDAVMSTQPMMDAGVALDMRGSGEVAFDTNGMRYCVMCSKDYTSAEMTEFTLTIGGGIKETEETEYKPPSVHLIKARGGPIKDGKIGDMISFSSRAKLIQDEANNRAKKREDGINRMLAIASSKIISHG